MNLFYVDRDPRIAAECLPNKLIVKMPVECAQLLATAFTLAQLSDPSCPRSQSGQPRRHFNPKHPCAIWTRASSSNFKWVLDHAFALSNEYTHRYDKVHAIDRFLCWVSTNAIHTSVLPGELTAPAQAMPDQYRRQDPVEAYQNYMIAEKSHYATWKRRPRPAWWN